ncbi:hypothetical protein [uncultured Gammaproteobacteria bacterium]|nr:hypothetical protein [uncultured Gammaproteobacteria bacterium]CAC9633640.1 hypothetical protein [uncultured Gammaproteobacteria bacterium]
MTEIQDRINNNKNKTSTSETACEEMNEQLKTFLGRDDLIFEVVEGGYEVKRNGKTADRLSEGEKTAIAFVYFTIHLKDRCQVSPRYSLLSKTTLRNISGFLINKSGFKLYQYSKAS